MNSRVVRSGSSVATVLIAIVFSTSESWAQSWTNGRLTVRAAGTIADSLIDFASFGLARFTRLTDGRVLVGPLPEATIVRSLSPDMREQRPFMRRGQGPAEAASNVLGIYAADRNHVVVTSVDPLRSTVFDGQGRIQAEALSIVFPDGTGLCDGQLFQSGLVTGGPTDAGAIFRLRPGGKPEKVYDLKRSAPYRRSEYRTQFMDVLNNRILVARPQSPFVVVTKKSCEDFTEIAIQLPWLREQPKISDVSEGRTISPDTTVRHVHWFDANHGMILVSRATQYAKPRVIAQGRGVPTSAPDTTRLPYETVLVVFDVSTGAVAGELVLPRLYWSFLSNRELVQHSTNPENEWYQVYSIELRGK